MATATKTDESADIFLDTSLFPQKSVEARGTKYTFRELSAGEYDQCVKNASDDEGVVNSVQLLRWMMIKGSVEPKLTASAIANLPLFVIGELGRVVNDLNYGEDSLQPLADRLRQSGWKVEAPEKPEAPKD